jgi:hypothetical protein
VKLTTIQYGDPAHRDIAGLRQLLQNYVNLVMAFAKDVGRCAAASACSHSS